MDAGLSSGFLGERIIYKLFLTTKQNLMPTLQELNAKVDELQTALDEEQTAIQAAIDALTVAAADLQTQLDAAVAAGGTDADRQAVLDKINAVITDLQATIA